jgi:pSer/pThr/pTyr-binding forkhead associated (FHA) protein
MPSSGLTTLAVEPKRAGCEGAMSNFKIRLRVVQGQPAGKTLAFPRGEYYFGRGAECQVRPNSDWVSRQHCLLRVTVEGAYLCDLGSRNGTLVNGVLLLEERRLRDGDQIQIGPLVFEVQIESPPTSEKPTLGPSADTKADLHLAENVPGEEPANPVPDTESHAPLQLPDP